MIKNPDNELIERLQANEVGAFNALYWKYHRALYANILKIIRNPEVAQDILQEVFVALWEKRLLLDINQSVAGWLFVTSYNKSITHLKQMLRLTALSAEFSQTTGLLQSDTEYLANEDQFQVLQHAISKLSPQKRRVFELCKIQGKTYEEAAQELNISKHTVKEYLSAAINYLREVIKKNPNYREALFLWVFCFFLF